MAIQAVVKHKYDVNKLKAETQYLIEAKKNMGKGGVDARQDFTDDCIKMWRSIEEALGLDDLILSQRGGWTVKLEGILTPCGKSQKTFAFKLNSN